MARTWDVTVITVVSIWKLMTGTIPASNIGGPLQISMVAGQQAQPGLVLVAFFIALISVNLFLLNLLPVPMLDGGHLLFFAFEAVLGRPLSLRKREIAQQIGFALAPAPHGLRAVQRPDAPSPQSGRCSGRAMGQYERHVFVCTAGDAARPRATSRRT